jgi:protein TonB
MTALAANYRIFDLPWTPDEDESRRLKRTARTLLIVFAAIGILIPLIPMSERPKPAPLPEEVVRLVLEPPPAPPKVETKKPEPPKPEAKPEPKPVPQPVDKQAEARKKAEKAGLLAMKDELEDLRQALEPTEMSSAPMIGKVEGESRAERSLVTSRTGVGSGGINTGRLSSGFGSGPGNLKGHSAGTAVPSFADKIGDDRAASRTGSGGKASRSREEIEIVFDRNKSAIYSLYSRALREQPELQGKVVVQLTIAPSGEVTDCRIVSTELNDAELEKKLVARIRMFRFEARDVEAMTTTKPIEFFPA